MRAKKLTFQAQMQAPRTSICDLKQSILQSILNINCINNIIKQNIIYDINVLDIINDYIDYNMLPNKLYEYY